VSFKVVELVVILGGLWLLWRSASRVGAQAAEQRAREAEDAARKAEDDAA
jgi:hypothetical protein